jgi:hypothetical protein
MINNITSFHITNAVIKKTAKICCVSTTAIKILTIADLIIKQKKTFTFRGKTILNTNLINNTINIYKYLFELLRKGLIKRVRHGCYVITLFGMDFLEGINSRIEEEKSKFE